MEDQTIFEDYDVGLIDRVIRFRGWEVREEESDRVVTRNQSRQDTLPEDLMAALEEHIGDGLAKVTVGGELGHSKEYGCKAQSFVSISVHCNNDEETLKAVKDIVQEKVRTFVNEDLAEMIVDRDRWMEQDKAGETGGKIARQPATEEGKAKPKPRGRVRSRPSYSR